MYYVCVKPRSFFFLIWKEFFAFMIWELGSICFWILCKNMCWISEYDELLLFVMFNLFMLSASLLGKSEGILSDESAISRKHVVIFLLLFSVKFTFRLNELSFYVFFWLHSSNSYRGIWMPLVDFGKENIDK